LRVIAYFNPLTYGVEGLRYGLLGSSSINPLVCLLVLGGFAAVMIVLVAGFYKNKSLSS